MVENTTPNTTNTTKVKNSDSTLVNIFIVVGVGIAILWLLYLTNLATLIKIAEADLPAFKEKIAPVVFVFSIIYVIAIIFNFYLKDKKAEWQRKESGAVILVSGHERIIPIRSIAKEHYGMNLGKLVYSSPLGIFGEAGAFSTTRFFLFENLNSGIKNSRSLWYEHYAKKITTHLYDDNYLYYATNNRFRHGEPKTKEKLNPNQSVGMKKANEIKAGGLEELQEDSMTE